MIFCRKTTSQKNKHKGHILIAIDRFSRWPTAILCKTSETKEVIIHLISNANRNGTLEMIKSDKRRFSFERLQKTSYKAANRNETLYNPKAHRKRNSRKMIKAVKHFIEANIEDGNCPEKRKCKPII